jgi:hypothetical protein
MSILKPPAVSNVILPETDHVQKVDREVENLAAAYAARDLENHYQLSITKLKASDVERVFLDGFKFGMSYLTKKNNCRVGEIVAFDGELLPPNTKVKEVWVEVAPPGEFFRNNIACQIINFYTRFDNEDNTTLHHTECYSITPQDRTEIPAGKYEFSDYLIQRALCDKRHF